MKPKIIGTMGAYNEERSIGEVLSRYPQGLVDEIIVLDDGSTDRTPEIIAQYDVKHFRQETNQGVGVALKRLFRYALDQEYDIFVAMSGNGKDDPREIPALLAPILEEGYDYVQGSRNLPGGSSPNLPIQRVVLVKLLALLYRITTGFPSTDPSNGFRAFRLSILRDPRINIWQDWLDDYGLEHYLNYLVIKLGYRVKEVPVTKTYPADRKVRYSHVRPFVDWWISLRPIFYLKLGLKD